MAYFVKFGYLEPEIKPHDLEKVNDQFTGWLRDIRATGRFVMTGAIENRSYGMTILQADSLEEATKLFSSDPFNEFLTSWDVHHWHVVEDTRR